MAISGVGNPMQMLQGMLGNILSMAKPSGGEKNKPAASEKKSTGFQNKSKQAAQLNKLGFKGNNPTKNSDKPVSAGNSQPPATQKIGNLCPQRA